jgi:uncharacterized protein (TIGR01244 family)
MQTLHASIVWLAVVAAAGCTSTSAPPAADLMNRAEPMSGILTGGQPDEGSLQDLAKAGYVAVIDLRRADEDRGFDEKSAVEGLGMSYISLPISGANAVTYDNATVLDGILGDVAGPVLLHCASGNRVGALLSLREHMHGASDEEALRIGTEAGLSSLRETVETRLDER